MRKRFLVMIAVLLSGTSMVNAQTSIGLDSALYSYVAVETFNSSDTFKVLIRNSGPQPFSGLIHVMYAVDSSGTGNMLLLQQLADDSLNAVLAVGDTVSETQAIAIYTGIFRQGINTVVIWPRSSSSSSSFITQDSLKLNVLVDTVLGIHDLSLNINTKLFPNPAQEVIYVLCKDPRSIEQVRFYSAEGRLLRAENFAGKLDLSGFSKGIYFIELLGTKGSMARYKVIKE